MNTLIYLQALAALPAALFLLTLLVARRLRRLERQLAAADRAAGQALVEAGELAVRADHLDRLRLADAAQLDTARAGVNALRLMVVEEQAGAMDALRQRVDAIERDAIAAFDTIRTAVDAQQIRVDGVRGDAAAGVREVRTQLAELKQKVADYDAWRSETNDHLDELDEVDKDLQGALSAAQTALAQAQQKTAVADGVAALVGKTAARLERVDGSVQSLYTHLETFKSRIDGVERRVNDLAAWRERTDGLPDPSAPLAERVQILTGRLDAVCEVADDLLKTRAAGVRAVAAVTSLLNHLGGAAASARHALEGRG